MSDVRNLVEREGGRYESSRSPAHRAGLGRGSWTGLPGLVVRAEEVAAVGPRRGPEPVGPGDRAGDLPQGLRVDRRDEPRAGQADAHRVHCGDPRWVMPRGYRPSDWPARWQTCEELL